MSPSLGASARSLGVFGWCVLASVAVGACRTEADPFETTYNVQFPSTDAAIATETIEVAVFTAARQDDCQGLFERRRTGQTLPNPVFVVAPITPCDLFNGKGGTLT